MLRCVPIGDTEVMIGAIADRCALHPDQVPASSCIHCSRSLYSQRATYLVSFFGGMYGAALFGWLNARRMGRLGRDGWLYALAAVAWSCVMIWGGYAIATESVPQWLADLDIGGRSGTTVRLGGRFLAVGLSRAMFIRQRAHFSAQEVAGIEPAAARWAGVACVLAAIVLSGAALGAGIMLGGGLPE